METPKKRKDPFENGGTQKKPRVTFTPIKVLGETTDGTVENRERWTYGEYSEVLFKNFLFLTGLKKENLTNIVYGIQFKIDGVDFFKIGCTDSFQDIKTPFGKKNGRLRSSLKDLNRKFNKVRIVKIHFAIQEDPDRDIFKLLIESSLLKATKFSMVNPGAEIGLNLKEFRSMEDVAEYYKLVEELCQEHELLYALA